MGRKKFFLNAVILTGTSLLLRLLGMVLRVYVAGQIGSQGMGLYQLVTSVYSLAVTVASSGMNVAVTRLVAARPGAAPAILRKSILISGALGCGAAAVLYFTAPWIGTNWLSDARTVAPLRVLPLALPCIAVCSCLSGYFLARRVVIKTSVAQVTEQVTRIAATVFLLSMLFPLDLEKACVALAAGTCLSELVSCLFHFVLYAIEKKKKCPQPKGVTKALLRIATPLALTSWLRSALATLENLLIPRGFKAYGGTGDQAIAQYGALKGMTMPILFFPAAFLSAISRLLIPEITEAAAKHQVERMSSAVSRTIHLTLCASVFFGTVFLTFPAEISQAVYRTDEAAYLMWVFAPLVPFMYLETMSDGLLKGLNQQVFSLRYNLFDSLVRISLIWFLLPVLGMRGYIIVLYCSNMFCCFLSAGRLISVVKLRVRPVDWVVKPVLAGVAACVCGHLLTKGQSALWACVLGIPVAAALYLLLLWVTKAVTKEDLSIFRRRRPQKA